MAKNGVAPPHLDPADVEASTFRRFAESASVGCAIFKPDGKPSWLNPAYLKLTGLELETFGTGGWQKALHADDLALVEARFASLARGEDVDPFEFRISRAAQGCPNEKNVTTWEYRWLLSNAFVDRNEDGSTQSVMGWLTDITSQKWAEHLQQQRVEDVLENKRQTEKFIDMVSHEVRNPLSAILQSADGIITAADQQATATDRSNDALFLEKVTDAANTILLCAQHQKHIVDDILTLSKMDSNLLTITTEPADPREIVKKALKMFQAELCSSGITTCLKTDNSFHRLVNTEVELDSSRILQILVNLLSNAIKFTHGRPRREIKINLLASETQPCLNHEKVSYVVRKDTGSSERRSPFPRNSSAQVVFLIFAIEDSGPGINFDEMKLLFQRFSQASAKTYGDFSGSGLGLFISRELVELHGGRIGLSSVPGQGTTFTFYVKAWGQSSAMTPPLDDLESATAIDNFADEELHDLELCNGGCVPIGTVTPPDNAADCPQQLTILLVEDNDINRRVMTQQLQQQGCVVHTANDGLEALKLLLGTIDTAKKRGEAAASFPFPMQISCILCDLEMPVMDGLTCVREIRRMEELGLMQGHIPVIAITANARMDQANAAREAGMVSHIAPYETHNILREPRRMTSSRNHSKYRI